MARKKRVQTLGYHYITSSSIDSKRIFIQKIDYINFIQNLNYLSSKYSFSIHAYAILTSSYHIILQTSTENLSMILKYLNSNYTKYFNKTYNRKGTLWNIRSHSFFISDINYLPYFLKYVEYTPILVGASMELELYYYSSYRQFIGLDQRLPLLKQSFIFKNFNTVEEIKKFFSTLITKDDIEHIYHILEQKEKLSKRKIFIESFLSIAQSEEEKNRNILKAYKNGFTQKEIASTLNISQQAIQQKIKILTKNE